VNRGIVILWYCGRVGGWEGESIFGTCDLVTLLLAVVCTVLASTIWSRECVHSEQRRKGQHTIQNTHIRKEHRKLAVAINMHVKL
jgi:hypothetical protein